MHTHDVARRARYRRELEHAAVATRHERHRRWQAEAQASSCDPPAVERLDRDLLALCDVPRHAATIEFLLCGGRPVGVDVAARLEDLRRRGWVTRDPERQELS